jgi:DNA-binding CsgD family transcriptional regulator
MLAQYATACRETERIAVERSVVVEQPTATERSVVLRTAADRALTGAGAVLVVTGEAGIGKTHLLSCFRADLEPEFRVLAGACDDVAKPLRLGPLREAGWPVDLDHEELLDRLGTEPTALLIDDIQWADDATLDLLEYLAGSVDSHPVVVVLALADDRQLPEHLRRRLAGLLIAGAWRLSLAPLDLAEVRRRVAGPEAEQLYALTRGNPFYLSALLAAAPGGAAVPDVVCDAVLAKTARLSEGARSVVEQLAVLPGTTELKLVRRLIGGDADSLDEAKWFGLLELCQGRIGFRHEIVRLALEQSLPSLSRRSLHKRALDVQAVEGDRYLARLAHHATVVADVDAVARYAVRAGRQAAAGGAHDEALRMFDAAATLGVLPADCAGEYAWELFNAFRFTEAIAAGLPEELHHFADAAADGPDHLENLYHCRQWDELDLCLGEFVEAAPERHRRSVLRCLLQVRRGQWDAAEATLLELRSIGADFLQLRLEPVLARLLVRRGAEVEPSGVPSYVVPVLIEQAFLAGDIRRVAALRDEWCELESTPVWPEIQRYCVRAGLGPSPGDWAVAAQEWERLGDTYEQALELAGSDEIEPTFEAWRLLDELGARPAADLVRGRLHRLGMRVVPRGPTAASNTDPSRLTARQAEVLELIAKGLTNAEIAELLALSVRTVDHHVSAILSRLNVSTRREAVAAANRPGSGVRTVIDSNRKSRG